MKQTEEEIPMEKSEETVLEIVLFENGDILSGDSNETEDDTLG